MKLIKPLLFFLLTAIMGTLQAQDIHFSLFNMSPLTLNPANTGAFYGTARIGGIYRGQWYNVSGADGYETPSFYVDAPILRGFRDQDWIGVGGAIYNDNAGTVNLRTSASMLSASYHLGLGKDGKSVLTLGLQGGNVQRRFDSKKALFDDSFDRDRNLEVTTSQDPLAGGTMGGGNDKTSYLDFAAGLLFRSQIDAQSNFELGVAAAHLTQPKDAFAPNDTINASGANKRPMRITAHTKYEWALTDRWSAAPTAMFQASKGATEVSLQAWAGYMVNPEMQVKLNFGLGYRFGDAGKVLLGLDYKDLRVAAAYDVNFSQLNAATNYQGAFEIAAWYIIKIFKDPEVKQAILCPKF
ncbi:MAG: PorP/SprF family type IX secretion system membrane protein [Lewinellaceae bacterium]|nr:PorP/SprF family type IX secretion system membrane protein [Phaeodactylibacter sp.]MCB9036967.1 PorP/SprF family type IX secretion system membrane protein [Lewinellaceae bacterium]